MKALAGYYYVAPVNNAADVVECRARGIFKKKGITPLVGDRVIFSRADTGEGTVEEIFPRTSELIRPPIANVEQVVLVFSVASPALNLQLIDKFLVHIEHAGLETLLVFTKMDLADAEEARSVFEAAKRLYEEIGYTVLGVSAKRGEGIEEVLSRLRGRISVFSGQSGVGKSSLLNAINPHLRLETNEISEKLGRGKHTTRHVELIPLADGGLVADTPGFSQLDFTELESQDLSGCFVEFARLSEGCKFRGCLHTQEPKCKVREAVEAGQAAHSRYEHYSAFLQEIKNRKPRY